MRFATRHTKRNAKGEQMNNDELRKNDTEKQPNWIARAWQRLKNKLYDAKVVKRVSALVVAATIVASLAACNFTTTDENSDGKIVCPICGENHTEDQHNSQEQGYSALFHSVVENEEYLSKHR